ncbi:MAG: glycosyltransferase family 39 protein, partial [Chloroflexi bacterium]|nr:glycosyltransferase family 39 protein [Chloroflexota bacterium]
MIQLFLRYKNKFWLRVALLAAFFLRVYRLDAQSLWNDEGTSIALASLNLDAIINGAARDIHPPLYYFLLHFWIALVGNSEFAARFLSVGAGVLVVVVTFRLARKLFAEKVGSIAAFLAALSPLLIYYSQETRMYIFLPLWSALAVWAMVVMLEVRDWRLEIRDLSQENPTSNFQLLTSKTKPANSRTRRTLAWLAFIIANIAALYTHYFSATLVLFENLAFAFWLGFAWNKNTNVIARSREAATKQSPDNLGIASRPSDARNDALKHTLAFWLIGQLIIAAAFLPWYLFAGNQLASWPAISEPFDLLTLLARVANIFSVGFTLEGSIAAIIALIFAILFLVGIYAARNKLWLSSVLGLWTIVPVAVMYAVSLTRPAYNPKFLLLALPPFLILCARGLEKFKVPSPKSQVTYYALRFTQYALGILLVVFTLLSLANYYFNPRYARDDYRAIFGAINATARANDGILIDAPGQADVVRYYNHRALALYPLPRMRPPDSDATRADVEQVLARVEKLYAIYWATEQSDPQNIIETKLAENAFPAREEWFGNVRLAMYGIATNARGETQTLNARLGDEIVLQTVRVDTRRARVGEIVTLTLTWR